MVTVKGARPTFSARRKKKKDVDKTLKKDKALSGLSPENQRRKTKFRDTQSKKITKKQVSKGSSTRKTPGKEFDAVKAKSFSSKDFADPKAFKSAVTDVRDKTQITQEEKEIGQSQEKARGEKEITQETTKQAPDIFRAIIQASGLSTEIFPANPFQASSEGGIELTQEAKTRAQTGVVGGMALGGIATIGLPSTVAALGTLATGILGVDTIATWAVVDNVASSIPFQMTEISKGLAQGTLTPADAEALIQQAENQLEFATDEVNISTMLNPFLWPARKRYQAAVEVAKDAMQLRRDNILGLIPEENIDTVEGR